MGLIVFVVVCWAIGRWLIEVSGESVTRAASAIRGNPPPPAREKRQGLTDFVREAWHGHWEHAARALAAARASAPPGTAVRWRTAWDVARSKMRRPDIEGSATVGDADPGRASSTPQAGGPTAPTNPPAPQPRQAEPAETPAPPTPNASNAPTSPAAVAPVPADGQAGQPEGRQPKHAAPDQTQGGSTMTTPTGEVVNYETHVADLNAQITTVQRQLDSAMAAEKAATEFKARVDELQQNYSTAAAAAQSNVDHVAALNLDVGTVGHASDVAAALPPNAVDQLFEHVESMEAEAKGRRLGAETALASLQAQLAHVQSTYGDAHATVAGSLRGDARYLDGGAGTVTSQQPVAAAA